MVLASYPVLLAFTSAPRSQLTVHGVPASRTAGVVVATEGLASAGDAAVFRAKSAAAAMDDDELERELEMEFEIQEELEREGVFEDNFEVSIHSPQKTRTSKQYT